MLQLQISLYWPPPDNFSPRPGLENTAINKGSCSTLVQQPMAVVTVSNVIVPSNFGSQGSLPSSTFGTQAPLSHHFSMGSTHSGFCSPFSREQPNINPFYVKVIAGNMRICQGCRGGLKLPNGEVPPPPFDLAIARMEQRPYRDVNFDNSCTAFNLSLPLPTCMYPDCSAKLYTQYS